MIAVLLADGFEELEALTPVDILRRNDFDVKTVSIYDRLNVMGAHGIEVMADMSFGNLKMSDVEHIILPGGMPGTLNLDNFEMTSVILEDVKKRGGLICAICAAPSVLGKRGYLKGHDAVCFPGFEEYLNCDNIPDVPVCVSGNVITGNGMPAAMEFANTIVEKLNSIK